MKLHEAIASVPKSVFSTGKGEETKVNYPGVFIHAVCALLDARNVKYNRETVEKIAEHVNLATFQRQAALERIKRGGAEKGGGALSGPVAGAPKKTAKSDPINGPSKKKKVDPISGEAKVKAAKPEVAAPKKSPPVAKEPAKKAAAPAKPKVAAPKKEKVKPAAPEDEIDPING